MRIDIYHHIAASPEVMCELRSINGKLEGIMANEAEIIQQLREAADRQRKTNAEIRTLQDTSTQLVEKVAELQAIIDAAGPGGTVTQELVDVAKEVSDLAAANDEAIPDVPAEPTPQP